MDSSIVDDLAAEQAALDDLVRNLDEEQWAIPSPAAGWNVRDEIAHLAFFDDVAVKSISGEGEARYSKRPCAPATPISFAARAKAGPVARCSPGGERPALRW